MSPPPPADPGPLEQALSGLWDEARARLYRPRNVLTWLDLARRFDLRLVRPSKVKVVVPRGLLPDCEGCVELCCTGPNAVVGLRLLDLARLVDAGFEPYIVPRDAGPDEAAAASPARRRLEGSVYARMFPVLARDATGTCRLLTEERMCGAWPAWPMSCQRYPYAFDAEHEVVFLAKGCHSHRTISVDDAPDAVRRLVNAAVYAYNERVKDIVLLHVALEELHGLGLLRFLELEGRLAAQARALGPHPALPAPEPAQRAPARAVDDAPPRAGRRLPLVGSDP